MSETAPRVLRTLDVSRGGLLRRRWALEMLEAVADGDCAKLKIAIGTPGARIDGQVVSHGRGAALDWNGIGFYDSTSAQYATTPLFKEVVDGDTLLTIAFRQYDASIGQVLLEHGAPLGVENSRGESPMTFMWSAKMALEGHEQKGITTQEVLKRMERHRGAYEHLVQQVASELSAFHSCMYDRAKQAVTQLYRQRCPDRLRKIDAQLEQFYGRENDLVCIVKAKYEEGGEE